MKPEVIIIGGGIIGTACAYFLSRRGVKVLVLERSHLCSGASGSTAAIISISGSSSTPEPLRALNVESYNLVLDLAEDFDPPLEIDPRRSAVCRYGRTGSRRDSALLR